VSSFERMAGGAWVSQASSIFQQTVNRIEAHPLLATLYPLVKQSAIYLAGAGVVGLGNFILVPLYTRCLTPADFGVYALLEIALLITVTIVQLGLGTAYLRWYAESAAEQRSELLASSGFVALAAGTAGGCVLVVLTGLLGSRWLGPLQGMQWVFLPVVICRNLQGVLFSALQASQRAAGYSSAAVARLLALSSAGIWFVGVKHEGVQGVLHSWLVGDGICALLLLGLCMPRQRWTLNFELLTPMLKYGFPLVWSSFMALLLDASGRFFLAHDRSLAEVGLYAVGIKITGLFNMSFLQPFGNAWAGMAFPIAHRPNAPVTYTKILGYALVVAMLVVALMLLFGPYLVILFAGRLYLPATHLLPWLLLPLAFRLLEYWGSLPLYLKYKTHWLGPLATAGVLACLALNALLVPRYGAFGAALAWGGALAVDLILLIAAGRRLYPLPTDVRTFGFAVSLWLLGVAGSRLAGIFRTPYAFGVSTAIAAALLAACVWYFQRDVLAARALFAERAYAD
jgi:O-antigen/teichoic acid export membrane protein